MFSALSSVWLSMCTLFDGIKIKINPPDPTCLDDFMLFPPITIIILTCKYTVIVQSESKCVTTKRVLAGAAVRLFFYLSLGRQLLAQSHQCDIWSAPTATTDSALFCRVTPLAFATLCHLQLMPTLSAPCRWPLFHSRWLPLLTLLLCGDVECNPGPRRLKYPCGSCQRAVMSNQPGVQCEGVLPTVSL